MTQLSQLLDLSHVSSEQIEITQGLITLSLAMETTEADCPICGTPAHHVHSRYERTLQDLSCAGKGLRLLVRVRRFFCDNPACARKIFAERLPDLTSVYARRTTRCTAALTELGFALGGKAGARLSGSLGLESSRMTILRILRRTPCPAASTPRILGVDDWAYRRGKTYGTLLVDLERSTPVDLLPDRQAATLAAWLPQHPGILLISRDRAGEYASGATQGAPEAIQSADRFHVVRNLADTMERALHPPSQSPQYEAVRRLVEQGLSHRAIAHQLHMHRESVIRYARAERFPERPEQSAHPGILAPYETYLRTRFLEGERNGVGLWRELTARGYTGSRMTVERFLQALRLMEQQGLTVSKAATTVELTPRRTVGLMLRQRETLSEEEHLALGQVCQLHPHINQAHTLFQQFMQLVRFRRGAELEPWMQLAFHSGFPNSVLL